MITSFFRDANDFHRATFWVEKRRIDFGADEISQSDDGFKITVDVSSFHPNELKLILEKNELTIFGHHSEKSERGHHSEKSERGEMSRDFSKRYLLPEDIDAEKLKSNLSSNGILKIEAPKKSRVLSTRNIPIEYR
ncbi:unnamed protein product, partial [Mesorhabditis belari]|uniref:SHSP domain-containing protein n=1 Tax=Mesorhabditis belari TaxID=2138241 RepID=A0AAF3FNP3_9BILA